MTEVNSWPGVSALWPGFEPLPWSSEAVAEYVTAFFTENPVPGLKSIFSAKPRNWDDPKNFAIPGANFGVGAYVYAGTEHQTKLRTGDGLPERDIVHEISVFGLFRSTLADTSAAHVLQRRIEDGIKQAIRNNPTLGGRVQAAGVRKLSATRAAGDMAATGMEIWFRVDFSVEVVAPPAVLD